jgi:hypothetical protein
MQMGNLQLFACKSMPFLCILKVRTEILFRVEIQKPPTVFPLSKLATAIWACNYIQRMDLMGQQLVI